MSNVKLLVSVFLGATLIAGVAAQEKKIYRWVDKDGKVQISDQLPPDAVDKARKEYNAKTGSLKNDVQSQLSPAEKAAAEHQAQAEAAVMAEAEKAKRIEQSMLINYATEQDLQRFFDERTDLLKQTIISLKASIQSRRAFLISSLNEMSEAEINGQTLDAGKLKMLAETQALVAEQTAQMDRLNVSYRALQAEFAKTLDKYRSMKAEADSRRIVLPVDAGAAPAQP
ncbi:MAG: DUF4124 domain-containing protein [Arenimonas sp.]|jgi:DNA-binding transcriptional regulator PaaX|uniref:DUF4124 domain-containing protein n=1 Tax=Arenimonas sp. TaxID=1872635 RepID=UPI001B5BD195|nr:DUF4124 domain-containing protein [Arenimonas sp.]MBP7891555.1 DUF4124 domain-containing protein [Arenimonas sp.]